MSSTQTMRCDHQWRWLDRVHVSLDRAGNRTDYRNVECTICGLRAWMHGKQPNAKPVVTFAHPTTERS